MKNFVKPLVFITIVGFLFTSGCVKTQLRFPAIKGTGRRIKKVIYDFLSHQTLTLINIKQSPVNGGYEA